MEKKRKGLSASGILAVLALVLIPLLIGIFLMPGGGGSGNYDHYIGPVLPMTAISGGEYLEVRRNVDFDFSAYARERENILDTGRAIITDTYELTNTSLETLTVELAYGFEGQFTDPSEEFPWITIDGVPAQTAILSSVDVNGTIHHANNWEGYKKAVTEKDFLSDALTPVEVPDIPVTVLRFTDVTYEKPEHDTAIHYGIQFNWPKGTKIWVRDYGMTNYDEKTGLWQVYFREDMGEGWMFVFGEVPEDMEYVGVAGYNITEESILRGLDMHMEVWEGALSECLLEFAREYDFWAVNHGYPDPGYITAELLYDGALKRMADPDYRNPSGEIQTMSGVFYDVVSDIRMLYQAFSVTIPAGESVTVAAVFAQEASIDYGGPREPREGYDLATLLGSNLNFTEQTSSMTSWEAIEIKKQNFGFDLKKGITAVTLDLTVERYYLDVAVK